jgi:SAM-dependent methyltransferase
MFWTFVYHLEPNRWIELAEAEPIHPDLLGALPDHASVALDIGAGSGRLTRHLLGRSARVVAVEPASGLRARLRQTCPEAIAVAGWAEAIPVVTGCADLTASCGAIGPEPAVLKELERVTAAGGLIALLSPEEPAWFESNGWRRITVPAPAAPPHARWIDDFFGAPDPPHELLMKRLPS